MIRSLIQFNLVFNELFSTKKTKLLLLLFVAIISLIPNNLQAQEIDNVSDEVKSQNLFYIERNKNTNRVVYDVRIQSDGYLFEDEPLDVYWLLFADSGEREELNRFENNRAYGIDIENYKKDELEFTLSANDERKLFVRRINNEYKAIIELDKKEFILDHIYVTADEESFMPTVQYVEVFAKDIATGEDIYKKVEK
jgi:hypothetical protein